MAGEVRVVAADHMAIRCPNGHRLPWQGDNTGRGAATMRCRGHLLYVCRECSPVTRSLFVFLSETGPLVLRLDLTPERWHRARQLPDDAPTAEYLELYR